MRPESFKVPVTYSSLKAVNIFYSSKCNSFGTKKKKKNAVLYEPTLIFLFFLTFIFCILGVISDT